jgi:hypothetical protein
MARDIEFRWNEFIADHATKHGCSITEIESVVRLSRYRPRKCGDGKFGVEGRGQGGRMVRVIYLKDSEGTFYVIHAMPLTTRGRRG